MADVRRISRCAAIGWRAMGSRESSPRLSGQTQTPLLHLRHHRKQCEVCRPASNESLRGQALLWLHSTAQNHSPVNRSSGSMVCILGDFERKEQPMKKLYVLCFVTLAAV